MAFKVLIIVANIANICDKIQEYAGIDNLSLNIILGKYGFEVCTQDCGYLREVVIHY
jgi:hypothetical protein